MTLLWHWGVGLSEKVKSFCTAAWWRKELLSELIFVKNSTNYKGRPFDFSKQLGISWVQSGQTTTWEEQLLVFDIGRNWNKFVTTMAMDEEILPPILKLPKELLVAILSLLPFRCKSSFLFDSIIFSHSSGWQGLASCWGFLPMFALFGNWPPALQSFLCKALSSTGFNVEKHSLLSTYVLFRGSKPSW